MVFKDATRRRKSWGSKSGACSKFLPFNFQKLVQINDSIYFINTTEK